MKAPAWLSATVLTAVCASAGAEDAHAVTLRPVDAREVRGPMQRIAAAARGPDLPPDGIGVRLVSWPRPVAPGSELRLVSIELRYEGLVSRYCRLVLDDGKRARLLPLPPEAPQDACQRVKKVLLGDFNGDGWVDVIRAVVVPSQAGVSVEEPVAYLSRAGSDPAQRPSHCCAALLSGQLTPVDLASRATVARAVARLRERSGPQALSCRL